MVSVPSKRDDFYRKLESESCAFIIEDSKDQMVQQKLISHGSNNDFQKKGQLKPEVDQSNNTAVVIDGKYENISSKNGICAELTRNDWLIIITVGVTGAILLSVVWIFVPFPRSINSPVQRSSGPSINKTKFWDNSAEKNPQSLPLMRLPSGKKANSEEVLILSHLHLHGITEFTQTVKIESLVSRSTPSGLSKSGREAVRTLELIGPIRQRWLHYLLFSFKSLTTIIIDVDKVCLGLGPLYETDPVELPKLEKIVAENSHKCALMSWGFNIETPGLKQIEISKANLTKDFYGVFFDILNKTSSTIQEIEISESAICSECDITELQFDNLLHLSITKTINNDFYAEYEEDEWYESEEVDEDK